MKSLADYMQVDHTRGVGNIAITLTGLQEDKYQLTMRKKMKGGGWSDLFTGDVTFKGKPEADNFVKAMEELLFIDDNGGVESLSVSRPKIIIKREDV